MRERYAQHYTGRGLGQVEMVKLKPRGWVNDPNFKRAQHDRMSSHGSSYGMSQAGSELRAPSTVQQWAQQDTALRLNQQKNNPWQANNPNQMMPNQRKQPPPQPKRSNNLVRGPPIPRQNPLSAYYK